MGAAKAGATETRPRTATTVEGLKNMVGVLKLDRESVYRRSSFAQLTHSHEDINLNKLRLCTGQRVKSERMSARQLKGPPGSCREMLDTV